MRIIGILHSVKLVLSGKLKPGQSVFSSSGNFTVPNKVTQIQIFCVGGGGAGGRASYDWSPRNTAFGGGGGGYTVTQTMDVTPGQQIAVNIGDGGDIMQDASSTIVGSVTAPGGKCATSVAGANGGSGGGAGFISTSYHALAGNGGFDGSNGDQASWANDDKIYDNPYKTGTGGTGQHSTTRAFGESTGTMYAGGGGGGLLYTKVMDYSEGSNGEFDWGWRSGGSGSGGDSYSNGGGGSGAYTCKNQNDNSSSGTAGNPGTGGGGGGGAESSTDIQSISEGGSGIAIIRWGY